MLDLSRKLPIGVQSFEVMRNDQFIYVDKTQFIFRLVHSNRVYFLSRPRRFGKSLFLSMLKAYFLGQKELFKGLYIEKAEEERCIKTGEESWQEYPVLYFDFNTKNYIKTDSLISIINLHLDLTSKYEGWVRDFHPAPAPHVALSASHPGAVMREGRAPRQSTMPYRRSPASPRPGTM